MVHYGGAAPPSPTVLDTRQHHCFILEAPSAEVSVGALTLLYFVATLLKTPPPLALHVDVTRRATPAPPVARRRCCRQMSPTRRRADDNAITPHPPWLPDGKI